MSRRARAKICNRFGRRPTKVPHVFALFQRPHFFQTHCLWCKSIFWTDAEKEGFTTSIRELASRASSASTAGAPSAFRQLRKARGSAHRTRALAAPHIQHQDAHRGGTRPRARSHVRASPLLPARSAPASGARGSSEAEARLFHNPFDASLHRRPRRRAVLGRGRGGPQPGVRSAAPRLSSSRPTRRSRSEISLPRRASPDGTSSPAIRVGARTRLFVSALLFWLHHTRFFTF